MGHSPIPAAPAAAGYSPRLTPGQRALVLLRRRCAEPGCTERPSCDGRCWSHWANHAARTATAPPHPRRIWGWRG